MMSNPASPGNSSSVSLLSNEDLSQPGLVIRSAERHPFIVLLHVGLKFACVFFYLFCNLFNDSFVSKFVFLLFLVAIDFWTTKNITGRFLVGLRWWNYVDATTGKSQWVFEKAPETRAIDKGESGIFWTALLAMPIVWCLFAFTAFFTFRFQWLTIVVVAISLSFSNAYGYIRCKLGADKSITGTATSWLSLQVVKNMFRRGTSAPAQNIPNSGVNY